MKANELMLGDWVYGLYPNGDRYHRPFRISAVDTYPNNRSPRIVTEGGYGFQEEYLAPIPLTSEVLKKNGFEKQFDYQWEYCDNGCEIVISIAPQIEIDGEILGTSPINVILEGALFYINMTSDMCVHEFQHALRLCGIEKEIEI